MDKTKIAVDIFDKLAGLYQEKFMDVSQYHASLDIFCASVKKTDAHILELACGPGNITQYLLKQRPDFNILATDLAPQMIELGRKNNPTVDFQIMDCRAINQLTNTYDALMCGFCLPYLSKEDAIQLIADSSGILNPGGVLYLSTMEGDYNTSGLEKGSTGDELYMHYHEGTYLIDALEKNGFHIVKIERLENSGQKGTSTDLIIIAGKL